MTVCHIFLINFDPLFLYFFRFYLDEEAVGKIAVKIEPDSHLNRSGGQDEIVTTESQMVAEILGMTGVNYRHRNSDIIASSAIAGQEAQNLKVTIDFVPRQFFLSFRASGNVDSLVFSDE